MIANKSERKYFGVLKRLAKYDNLTINQLKVKVCEGEFDEEKQCFLVAPLMPFDSDKDLENKKTNQKQTDKTIEDSTEHSEISNENKSEILDDYPDSSDFSDDE